LALAALVGQAAVRLMAPTAATLLFLGILRLVAGTVHALLLGETAVQVVLVAASETTGLPLAALASGTMEAGTTTVGVPLAVVLAVRGLGMAQQTSHLAQAVQTQSLGLR
jgi:hypothetical protein